MSIPDFQSLILPLLKLIGDEEEYYLHEIINTLSCEFNLTDAEKQKLLPSGKQKTFDNRVGWARTYMKKAGLVKSPRRGFVKITDRGLKVIEENPRAINTRFLSQYPEFVEFQNSSRLDNKEIEIMIDLDDEDDDEPVVDDEPEDDDDDVIEVIDDEYQFSAKFYTRRKELLKLDNAEDENQHTLLVEGEDDDIVITCLFGEQKLVTVWNRSTALEIGSCSREVWD